jgi:hypothetical protein
MQFQKLSREQRSLKRWRLKRNHLVCQLMDKDKHLSGAEALKIANRKMGRMPKGR